MPKIVSKSGRKMGRKSEPRLDMSRFKSSIKIVKPTEWSADWTAGDGFENLETAGTGDKSCRHESADSQVSNFRPKARPRQSSSGSVGSGGGRQSPHKLKSMAKTCSRFVKPLSTLIEISSDMSANNRTTSGCPDEGLVLQDTSSPLKQSMPLCDDHSSPLKPNAISKEPIRQLIHKSIVTYLDDSTKKCHKLTDKRSDSCLLTKTLKVLKAMKQSRLEFSQRESLPVVKHPPKPLILKLLKVDTDFGISSLHCVVLNDENNQLVANTKLIVLFNHKIVEDLDLSAQYTLQVYPRWTQHEINHQIYISNAFNVEFAECLDPIDDQNTSPDYSVVWQNNRP